MSTSSSSSYTPLDIAIIEAVQVGNFINVALLSVVIYDSIITFGEEVRLIWCYGSRGKNVVAASMLFLANRYLAILYGVIGFVAGTVPLTTTCAAVTRLTESIILGLILCFALFSAYRVYALQVWNRAILAAVVFLLNLVPFCINLYAFVRYKPAAIGPSFSPCAVIDPLSPSLEIQFVRACRLSAIAADAIVLFSTLAKTVPAWIEARKLKIAVPLSTAIIQDGSAYFFILLVMNIFQMITFAVWQTEYLTTFIYVLTPVLSCRLMLNLRQVNNHSGTPRLNSHILYQLDDHKDVDDMPPMNVNFGNLNLDAFNEIIDSPSDSDSSSGTSHNQNPSFRDVDFPNLTLDGRSTTRSSDCSLGQSDSFSREQKDEIQEIQRRV